MADHNSYMSVIMNERNGGEKAWLEYSDTERSIYRYALPRVKYNLNSREVKFDWDGGQYFELAGTHHVFCSKSRYRNNRCTGSEAICVRMQLRRI